MKISFRILMVCVFQFLCCLFAQAQADAISVHDPVIIKQARTYYIFCTGIGISVFSSADMKTGQNKNLFLLYRRSEKVYGPYIDGIAMNVGGGSLLLEGDKNWNGVEHNAVAEFNGVDYLVFHGYDAHDNGKPKLRIEKLDWINGWPKVVR